MLVLRFFPSWSWGAFVELLVFSRSAAERTQWSIPFHRYKVIRGGQTLCDPKKKMPVSVCIAIEEEERM